MLDAAGLAAKAAQNQIRDTGEQSIEVGPHRDEPPDGHRESLSFWAKVPIELPLSQLTK